MKVGDREQDMNLERLMELINGVFRFSFWNCMGRWLRLLHFFLLLLEDKCVRILRKTIYIYNDTNPISLLIPLSFFELVDELVLGWLEYSRQSREPSVCKSNQNPLKEDSHKEQYWGKKRKRTKPIISPVILCWFPKNIVTDTDSKIPPSATFFSQEKPKGQLISTCTPMKRRRVTQKDTYSTPERAKGSVNWQYGDTKTVENDVILEWKMAPCVLRWWTGDGLVVL